MVMNLMLFYGVCMRIVHASPKSICRKVSGCKKTAGCWSRVSAPPNKIHSKIELKTPEKFGLKRTRPRPRDGPSAHQPTYHLRDAFCRSSTAPCVNRRVSSGGGGRAPDVPLPSPAATPRRCWVELGQGRVGRKFGRRKGGGAEAEPPASPLPPIVGAQRRVNRGVEGHAELQERGPLGSGGSTPPNKIHTKIELKTPEKFAIDPLV